MNIIRNGIPVTHRPDLSSMPQNELGMMQFKIHRDDPTYGEMSEMMRILERQINKPTGIIAEMAELTENRD